MATIQTYVGGYSRAFAVTGDRTVVVDAGARGSAETLLRNFERIGVAPETVSAIVVTHAHLDHIAPLSALKAVTRAPVLCHRDAGRRMTAGLCEDVVPRTGLARFLIRIMPSQSKQTSYPVDTMIDSEMSLVEYGIPAVAVPTPGHTSGSLSVVLDSGEALIGDLAMAFGPGGPTLPLFADNVDEVRRSLRMLLDRGVHTFFLAHGGRYSRSEIERILD